MTIHMPRSGKPHWRTRSQLHLPSAQACNPLHWQLLQMQFEGGRQMVGVSGGVGLLLQSRLAAWQHWAHGRQGHAYASFSSRLDTSPMVG